jgi:hypothetical protein
MPHAGSWTFRLRAVWGISVREQTARLQQLRRFSMRFLGIVPAWLVAACLAALAVYVVPRGLEADRLLAIADDPSAIAAHALNARFDAQTATTGIEEALAGHDVDLAKSFVDLAAERHVALSPALLMKVQEASIEASSTRHAVKSFAVGLVSGEPTDATSLAGTVAGDLFVFGDIRDAAREGTRFARGEPHDNLVLGLACVGLAITAGTYATVGLGTPARLGLTLIKAARKTGRIGAGLARSTGRLMRGVVDWSALKGASNLAHPVLALRAARDAVKLERAGKLKALARDVGKVQAKAGTQAALDAVKLAQSPADVARIAKLAEKEGSRTRAILKVLGRGAILLATGAFDLAMWLFGALFSILSFIWGLKRAVERTTERYLRRRKERRLRRYIAVTAH